MVLIDKFINTIHHKYITTASMTDAVSMIDI